jgi:diguanylate cyclase (GGDEF)-like protein
MREINTLHGLLRAKATTDPLTGLFNRSLLEDSLQQAIAQNQRTGVPMALITFDIDDFKSVNDTLGHDMGDEVLRGKGELLRRHTRSSDRAFRMGGEEFLVLVHNTGEGQGAEFAEYLRRDTELIDLLSDRKVTISVGVSELQKGMDVSAWMKACDEKLYKAKEDGRYRVVA